MRGKSSLKQRMEKTAKDDDLSGGIYIHTLMIKQLDPLSSENQDVVKEEPKKKVRRRFHTSKPYQEKLLNIAQVRKEIVTALKFHRAAMKKHHHQPQPPPPPPPMIPFNELPLGLNLNFHGFNIDNFHGSSTSSSSSSSSGINQQLMNIDKETEKIRSVGEQQEIDRVNIEIQSEENDEEDYGQFPFDEINMMEFPSWLNSNENENTFLDDYSSQEYYMQDVSLPWMEIEEIEGIDGEWLSSS